MLTRLPLRRAALAASAPLLLLLATCDAATLDPPAPCPCEVAVCSTQSCGFRIALDPGCAEDVMSAEVLIDKHLEAGVATAEEDLLACSRIEPGATASVWVRGGPWSWGPVVVPCEPPGGELHTLTFFCEAESVSESEGEAVRPED